MLSSDLQRVMLICTLRADLECQGQLDLGETFPLHVYLAALIAMIAEKGNIRECKEYLDGFPVWVPVYQDTSHQVEGCIPGCKQLQDRTLGLEREIHELIFLHRYGAWGPSSYHPR